MDMKFTLNDRMTLKVIYIFLPVPFPIKCSSKTRKGCFVSVIQLIDSIIGCSDTFSHDFIIEE